MKWLKKVKLSRLIFLIILLAGNTFAWFIYTSKIDGTITVHVKAWDVVFESNQTEVSSNVEIDISDIYPGMEDYAHSITAYNKSEVSASLSFKLLEVRILDEEYITIEGREELGEEPEQDDLTGAQLITKLATDYPFQITFNISNTLIAAEQGASSYTISAEWPYENNNDELDTQWGIAAAEFKEDNPTLSSIVLKIKLTITQNIVDVEPSSGSSSGPSSGSAPSSSAPSSAAPASSSQ